MPTEKGPESREPEDSMSDERFFYIYTMLKTGGFSDKEIEGFVKKYNEGGRGIIKVRKAQQQEKKELKEEQDKEREELESRVGELTDEELAIYSEKYYGKYWREKTEGEVMWFVDKFYNELHRRKQEKEEVEKLIEKVKSKLSPEAFLKMKVWEMEELIKKAKEEESKKPKEKRWWQFWK